MEIHMKKPTSTIFGRMLFITLMIPAALSLKDKRQVIKSLITKIRQRFNVSIIEAGFHEQWQLSKIGIAFIGNQVSFLDAIEQEILKFAEEEYPIEITELTVNDFWNQSCKGWFLNVYLWYCFLDRDIL